jgi:X-Pro dipeptidyl-peptidase
MRSSVLAVALLSLILAAPASAAEVTETFRVPTVDGAKVWVEVTRPAEGKVPVILTYSPYNALGGDSKDNLWTRYGPKGYARAVSDVLGVRNSTGCWDYGGAKEQQSGVDLVNFLAAQPWSNGKVAMIGGSYDGTTANMVAAAGDRAPGLAAIVPQAAISRWYGYAFSHGVRYSGNSQEPTDEGADTPVAFDFGLTRVPPSDPTSIDALADRIKECDAADHTAHGYDTSPDYDDFWLQRDYLKDAAKWRVPTLITHGWQDYNVKQEEGHLLWEALQVDDPRTPQREGVPWKGFYFFQAPHASPGGEPFLSLLDAFFDKFLLGRDSPLQKQPNDYTQGRDSVKSGEVEGMTAWPPPTTGDLELPLGRGDEGGTLGAPSGEDASYVDAPASSEEAAAEDLSSEGSWLTYQTAPLAADVRITGEPVLDATVSVDRDMGQLVPVLFDVDESGTATPITRGFLNLRYKDGLAKEVPAPTNTPTRAVVTFKPQDWTVRAGHRIALVIQSSNPAWAVPAPAGLGVTVKHNGASRVLLPIVGAAPPRTSPIPGGRPDTDPVPSGSQARELRVSARAKGRALRISGTATPGVKVKITVRRGKKATARKTVTARPNGAFKLTVKVRKAGRHTVTAQVRSREGLVTKRTRPVRVR